MMVRVVVCGPRTNASNRADRTGTTPTLARRLHIETIFHPYVSCLCPAVEQLHEFAVRSTAASPPPAHAGPNGHVADCYAQPPATVGVRL